MVAHEREAIVRAIKSSIHPIRPSVASAAVVLILRLSEEGLEMLLIKRKVRPDDPWSGHIAFPGGFFKEEDRTTLGTAEREAKEEVGIDLRRDSDLLGMLDQSFPVTRKDLKVDSYVALLRRGVQLRISEREVEKAFWVPLNKVEPGSTVVPIGGRPTSVMAYLYEGHTIWGMTARLIRSIKAHLYGFE